MRKFVTVASFDSPIEAHLAKGRLENEGVPVFIAHENHVWANWVFSQALGGVKVQVLEKNVEAARKVLRKHLKGEYELDLSSEFNDIKNNCCPKCGSVKFKSRIPVLSLVLAFVTLGLFAVIYPPSK